MSNETAQTHDINVGDVVIGTKDVVLEKIHALSRLQQKDASASQSKLKKVCFLCLCYLEQNENAFMHWQICVFIPMYIHASIRL